ncbi:MAG TPA: MotA/TolQ/ExbB proton channel family protein [Terrimicrobium sp.]
MKTPTANSKSFTGAFRIAVLAILLGFLPPVLNTRAEEAPVATEQSASAQAQQTPQASAGSHKKDKTFFEVLREGGIVMFPLAAVSVYMLTLIIDSVRRIQNKIVCPPDIVGLLRSQFSAGDYQAAFQTCRSKACFLTNVVRAGLSMLGQGKEITEKAMEDVMAKEIASMSTRIYYLNLIGVVTPMIGLTGTVLGMMSAFKTLGTSGIGDPSALAGAIGEVLVATATGLFVAIPGFASYYFFRNRIQAVSSSTEEVINNLFRGMPYAYLAGMNIGDDPIYAAIPKEYLSADRPAEYAEQP